MRNNSAVMQTSNSGKLIKIFINVKKWSKILKKIKRYVFFHLKPVSGFQLNVFWNGKFILTTSFKKTYEISDFALKNSLFSMICWSSPFHDQKLKFCLTKPQYITNILWKFEDFLLSSLEFIKVSHLSIQFKDGVFKTWDG